MKRVSIGVDIGTTQTKAVAFDGTGKVCAVAYRGYDLFEAENGMAEQEIDEIFEAVVFVIGAVVRQLPNWEVELVSFSCAMHSLIMFDEAGQPLTRMITWADTRAADFAERLRGTKTGRQLYRNTGMPLHAMTPFNKIGWLKEEQPTLFQQAAYFMGIKEYLFYRLFGRWVSEYSMASGTGYFNIHNFTWDELALSVLGIKETQLPELVAPNQQILGLNAKWAGRLGLEQTVPFIAGGADGALSNLGLGCLGDGEATLTVGTSGAIRYVVPKPCLHPDEATFCYVLDEEHWVIGGATSNGSVIFDWACEQFLRSEQLTALEHGDDPFAAVLAEVVQVAAGSEGLLFHPYLLGERAPLWNADAAGAFVGLKAHHNQAMMMRAVLEGICLNLRRILTDVEVIGGEVKELRATGGFMKSLENRQLLTDVLDSSISFTTISEASAFGAVMLGWQSLGKVTRLEEIKQFLVVDEKTQVTAEAAVYGRLFPLFVETQQQLAHSYRLLASFRQNK